MYALAFVVKVIIANANINIFITYLLMLLPPMVLDYILT